LGKTWPALAVSADDVDREIALAAADDYAPTAVEERDDGLRIFFPCAEIRDRALAALSSRFAVTPIDIDDEDWARRSQRDLSPVTVGRIVVHPSRPAHPAYPASLTQIDIVIPPSMGFGTGHHATTRLCLAALQRTDLHGKVVLDVGTGSGLLAIAAAKLGAARAIGIDDDRDAIHAAEENVQFNSVTNVEFTVGDLLKDALPGADVVLANLTGGLVVRAATRLVAAVNAGGVLIVSGVLASERDDIRRAFANQAFVDDVQEDEWLGFTVRC
jgi:ribosomal protein L11 methyltransferase